MCIFELVITEAPLYYFLQIVIDELSTIPVLPQLLVSITCV